MEEVEEVEEVGEVGAAGVCGRSCRDEAVRCTNAEWPTAAHKAMPVAMNRRDTLGTLITALLLSPLYRHPHLNLTFDL